MSLCKRKILGLTVKMPGVIKEAPSYSKKEQPK